MERSPRLCICAEGREMDSHRGGHMSEIKDSVGKGAKNKKWPKEPWKFKDILTGDGEGSGFKPFKI